jgi:hypothetical protein
MLVSARRFSLWAMLLLAALSPAISLAQERTGEILGTVTDESGAPVPGALVRAESKTLPRGLETATDHGGRYMLQNVPIGTYTVTVTLSGFKTIKQAVDVRIASIITLNPRLAVGSLSEAVEVVGTALSIDPTSSRAATNITTAQIENLAKGSRGFQSLLTLAPGVRAEVKAGSAGVGGIAVDGATGSENAYYIDGVEVSDLRRGSLGTANAIPLDFVQEVAVKSGGFEAEFGGATGGVINVATRSGSNDYHGTVGFQFTGSALNSPDRGYYQRSVSNADKAEFFQPKEDDYKLLYPSFSLSGPVLKDRLNLFVSYAPERERTTRIIDYASGARRFDQEWTRHYGISRLDFSPATNVQFNTTYMWSPAKSKGRLPTRDPRIKAPSNDLSIQGGYTPAQAYTASLNYFPTSKLVLSARYGYRYFNDKDGNYGLPQQGFVTYQTSSAQSKTPVPAQFGGGTGFSNISTNFGTQYDVTTRHNVYLDAAYTATLGGQLHTFKAGYAINRVANTLNQDFLNGRFLIYWGDSFTRGSVTNATGQYGYYTWEDGIRNSGDVNSRNQAFYTQDTWRAGSRLTLNLGVRFENEFLPPFKKEVNGIKVANPISFGWGDKIAPRLGAAWDIKGDGRWKAAASFGIFYDVLKYELARGSFGSDVWFTHVYTLDRPDVINLTKATPGANGREVITYDNRTIPINAQGQLEGIDPAIKPYKSREFSVSFDHQFSSTLVGGIRYTRKDLLRGIEDIGVLDAGDNEVYLIGNPGFGQTRDKSSVYGGTTPNGTFLVPKATRNYDGVELRLQGSVHENLHFLASYTWSRLFGNFSGAANSDESGRSDPGVSRAFDLPYYYFDETGSQQTREGRLGTDRPHAFKLFAYYNFTTGAGTTNVGVTQLAYSGVPDSTSVIYLSAPTFPFGRGDMGRTDPYIQTDLNLAHSFKLTKGSRMRFEANVRNLFNQDAVISRVTQLNRSGAISAKLLPVKKFFSGYNVNDYVNPQNNTGSGVPYNPIYGLPGASYRAGGGPGQSRAIGAIADRSAFSAANPNFGAYQDFRVIRLGVTIVF